MSSAILPGQSLAERYLTIKKLGTGGMGEVWYCLDLLTQQYVALKSLRPSRQENKPKYDRVAQHIQQLFYEEIRALASLDHPNLVQARDFGNLPNGSPFLVMDFIDGISLEELWCEEQTIPWHLLAAIADQLLSGLAHIHSRGILHRDLKPPNILLSQDNDDKLLVTLVDFGIAIVDQGLDHFRPDRTNDSIETPKVGLGTPPYVAPEQILGHIHFQGPATDLHAFGVLLYQFCCGRLPYWAKQLANMLRQVANNPPPPLKAKNGAPDEAVDLIHRLLAKRPWERFPFAASARAYLSPLWDPQQAHKEWQRLLWRRGDRLQTPTDREEALRSTSDALPFRSTPLHIKSTTHTKTHQMTLSLEGTTQPTSPAPLTEPSLFEQEEHIASFPTHPQTGTFHTQHELDWVRQETDPREPSPNDAPETSDTKDAIGSVEPPTSSPALVPPPATAETLPWNSQSLATLEKGPLPPLRHSPKILSLRIPSFIGRQEEQVLLMEEARRVRDGEARVVLLEGPPGIGKSRLAQWLLEQTHEQGMLLGMKGQFSTYGSVQGGILGAIEQYLSLTNAPREGIEAALHERWGADVSSRQLTQILCEMLRPVALHPRRRRRRALLLSQEARTRALQACLQRLAGEEALLLWLDDVQYIDEEHIQHLSTLLEQGPPMLLLLTHRQGASTPQEQLLEALCEQTNALRLTLQRLSPSATQSLLQNMVPLAQETSQALEAGSGGNPLFLLQQLFTWLQKEQLVWDGKSSHFFAPEPLLKQIAVSGKELWEQRLSVLPEAHLEAMMAATTLGSRFTPALFEQLLQALSLPEDTAVALQRSQLLILEHHRFRWSHGLLEEYVQESLTQHQRCGEIFRKAAEVLEAHPLHPTRRFTRLIVTARKRAGQPALASQRLFYFLEHAWKIRRDAPAIRADLGLLPEPLNDQEEAHKQRWLAEAALLSSHHTEAERAAVAALSLYQAQGDHKGVGEIKRILGGVATGRAQYEEAQRWLLSALADFQSLDLPESVAHIHLQLAQAYQHMSRLKESTERAKAAYQLAEQHNLNTVLVQSCLMQATTLHDMGEYVEARLWANITLEACRIAQENYGAGQAYTLLAWLDFAEAAFDDAKACCQAAHRCFSALDEWWWMTTTELISGWVACWMGQAQESLTIAERARKSFGHHQMAHEVGQTWLLTAACYLHQGELPSAQQAIQQAKQFQRPEPMLQQPLSLLNAWLSKEQGAHEDAHTSLQRAIEIWQQLGLSAWGAARLLTPLLRFQWPPPQDRLLLAWHHQLNKTHTQSATSGPSESTGDPEASE